MRTLLVALLQGVVFGFGWWVGSRIGGDTDNDPILMGFVYALGIVWAAVFLKAWKTA